MHIDVTVVNSNLVIEAVGDLMSNDEADGTIVHVLGPLAAEEVTLEDAGRELYNEKTA